MDTRIKGWSEDPTVTMEDISARAARWWWWNVLIRPFPSLKKTHWLVPRALLERLRYASYWNKEPLNALWQKPTQFFSCLLYMLLGGYIASRVDKLFRFDNILLNLGVFCPAIKVFFVNDSVWIIMYIINTVKTRIWEPRIVDVRLNRLIYFKLFIHK